MSPLLTDSPVLPHEVDVRVLAGHQLAEVEEDPLAPLRPAGGGPRRRGGRGGGGRGGGDVVANFRQSAFSARFARVKSGGLLINFMLVFHARAM